MTLARERKTSRWTLPLAMLAVFRALMPSLPVYRAEPGSIGWLLERRARSTRLPLYNPYPRSPYALMQRRRKWARRAGRAMGRSRA